MKKTAIYMRVSSAVQAQDGDSIPAQRDALRKYIDSHDDLIFADEYCDDGVSGTRDDRDELVRLLTDVKDGKIDLIIVTKLDRLYRSIRHYLNLQDTLDKHGVFWLAIWEPIYDTSTPQGRLIINQMMSIAQFEAENTGQRIRQVQAYKVTQGEVISGSTPPGYSIVDKHLVPNDDADAVRDVFHHYSLTGNLHETMRYASAYGIFPSTAAAFRKVLQNQTYIGVKRNNVSFCKPLIENALFHDVQRKLSINVKVSQKRTYIFSGLIRCAECGCVMAGYQTHESSRNNVYHNAYRCAKRYASGGIRRCTNTKVMREHILEKYLLDNIRPMISDIILKYEVRQKPQKSAQKQIEKLEKKKSRLKELYLNGIISLDEYKTDKGSIEAQIASVTPKMPPKCPDTTPLKDFLASDFETLYGQFRADEKRFLWRSVIQEIRFDKNRSIDILFLQ